MGRECFDGQKCCQILFYFILCKNIRTVCCKMVKKFSCRKKNVAFNIEIRHFKMNLIGVESREELFKFGARV